MHSSPKQVKALFLEAVDVPSEEQREQFLDEACAGDTELRDRVEVLIGAFRRADGFLETPAAQLSSSYDHRTSAEHSGAVIGRYKLLELIGEGGFGDVYMAEQQEPVRRKVALKIIKLGMDTRSVIARFEAERQALALMDHPNIAKVLDAGATETGRPYFVMDLVRGWPITEYCDANNLTAKERLGLFIDVCQAVQHAHQKGIIHRDIKPNNVMVTLQDTRPVPKIIDFGVAKATQQRLTEKTLFTEHHQLVGTPEYMSPEQATFGEADVDTRSDIYSLGVLLYELLIGTTPFDAGALRSHGYDEICRVIRESDPPTPSKRLSTLGDAEVTDISTHRHVGAAALRKLLRGDLDWIVMKALEKDRTRRYETAHGLARDIERHLNEELVRARPPSSAYRLKKLVRKHRVPVAATVGIFVALTLGLILATTGFLSAMRQRDRADHNAAQAEALTRTTRLQLYVSNVNSAYHAWKEGNVDRVRRLLSRHVPQPGEEDLRGFEWRYLWGQYERTLAIPTLKHASITCVAYSPDGTILASASYSGTVKLWNVASLAELRTLKHENSVLSVAFSPDGNIVASGSTDQTIRLWAVATGKLIATLEQDQEVASVAFSPDGNTLAAGCGKYLAGEIKLWKVATRAELATLSGHAARVTSVAFSPDGKSLASGSWDRSVRLWDVEAGAEIATLHGHTNRIYAVAFSPNGNTLASGGYDSTVKLWEMDTHRIAAELPESIDQATSLAFSASGTTLAVGAEDSRVWLWDVASKKAKVHPAGHSSGIRSMAFSPDSTNLATGNLDGIVKIATVPQLAAENSNEGHSDWWTQVAISPADGRMLAVGSGEIMTEAKTGELVLWDVDTREARFLTGKGGGPIGSVSFSPDGQLLAASELERRSSSRVVRLWDVPSGKLLRTLVGHSTLVSAVTFSPDGKTLASADWGHIHTANAGDWGATVKLWDVATGQLRKSLSTVRFAAVSMAFSPDGKHLAIVGGRWDDGEIKLWDVDSGEGPVTLTRTSRMVSDAAFSPDGRLLACGDDSGRIMLWRVADGKEEVAFDAHSFQLVSVAFSPDGKTLASGSWHKTVKLWHVATGDELATFKADAPISSVAFFPDGNTLAAGGRDKSVRLWHVNSEKEVLRARSE